MATRGLTLSDEKTRITNIEDGFDFLGFNIRKYKGKLLIKPSKKGIKAFLANIRETIRSQKGAATVNLIRILNPKVRGWANYYHHVVSKETFNYVDSQIFASIWQWCKRRHLNKGQRWIKDKYFESVDNKNWVLGAKYKNDKQEWKYISLIKMAHTPIKRHVKIKADATPFSSEYQVYFEERDKAKKKKRSTTVTASEKYFANTNTTSSATTGSSLG